MGQEVSPTDKEVSPTDKEVSPTDEEQFRTLRNNYEKAILQSDIRRAIVGGLNEEDVIKYIDSMREQYQKVEDELNNRLEEMRMAKEKLRHDFENYRKTTDSEIKQTKQALANALNTLSNCQNQLIAKDEKYEADLGSLIKEKAQLSEENSKIHKELELVKKDFALMEERFQIAEKRLEEERTKQEEIKNTLQSEQQENTNLRNLISELENQVDLLKRQVEEDQELFEEYSRINQELQAEIDNMRKNSSTANLKCDVDIIYKHLDSIAEQIAINDRLQQQLDMEKHRADKAEKDMIQFSEFLSNIKEHFKQNQSQLELQFIEIAQKQKDMENFINQVKANMITIGSNTGSQLEELYNSVEINNKISDNKCINIIKWRDKNTAVSG